MWTDTAVSRRGDRLRPYQVHLAEMIVRKRTMLLAAEMATGKTVVVLTAIRQLLDMFRIRRALIVAPLRVADETWPDEIENWSHLRGTRVAMLTGMPGQRMRGLKSRAEVYVINRENMVWLWETLLDLDRTWPFDFVAWDESSRLKAWRKRTAGTEKNPKQHNLTEFGAMAKARQHVDYLVEMTGTPAPNGVRDLGGQAYILDGGERLGKTKTDFENRWFRKDSHSYRIEPLPGAVDAIMDRLSDVMVGLRAEDYVDLPTVHLNPIRVQLPRKAMDEYKRFERTLVSQLYDVEAVSKGVLTNKLLQFANGSMYRSEEGEDREVIAIHDVKLDALERIIEEAAGQPVLLAYSFQFDLARIRKKFPRAVVLNEDKEAVKNWNAGKIDLLLTHPASAGHGLNLQFGGHIGVWYGLTWSLELFQQFNKRLPRPGQKAKTVFMHQIVATGTADEDVLAVLTERGTTQDAVTERVRKRIQDLQ